jgi:WD40 domain-containing protein
LMGCMKHKGAGFYTVISQVIKFDRKPPVRATLDATLLDPARIAIHIKEQPASGDDMHALAEWLIQTYLHEYRKTLQEEIAAQPAATTPSEPSTLRTERRPTAATTPSESSAFVLDRRRRVLDVGFDAGDVPMFVEADGKELVLRWPEDPLKSARLAGHRLNVLCATVSKNGRYVLSGGADGLRLWSVAPPAQIWFAEQLGGWTTCVACSFAGDLLLAGCMTALHLFASGGDSHMTFHRASCPVSGEPQCVALSADGTMAFAGGRDAKVWRWKTDEPTALELPAIHFGAVESIDCDQTGTTILSGGADGALIVCNHDGIDFEIQQTAAISQACLSPDGQYAVVGDHKSVGFWSLKHHSLLARWPCNGGVRAIACDYGRMQRVIFADDQAIYVRSSPVPS